MDATFVRLLKDPSGSLLDVSENYDQLIGSLDHHVRITESVKEQQQFIHESKQLNSALHKLLNGGSYGLEKYIRENVVSIGTESVEITEMITNFVKKLFNAIYSLLTKLVNMVKSVFVKITKIDVRLKDDADEKYKKFLAMYSKLGMDGTSISDANTEFTKYTISHMCSEQEFSRMMTSFSKAVDTLSDAHQIIKDRIAALTKPHTGTKSWITHDLISNLNRVGVSLRGTSSTYASPFQEFTEATLGTLQFNSLEKVKTANDAYRDHVWTKYTETKSLVRRLEEYRDNLKEKEKELSIMSDINKQVISENITDIQENILTCIAVFSGLRQANTTINFRRKRLTELGIRAMSPKSSAA